MYIAASPGASVPELATPLDMTDYLFFPRGSVRAENTDPSLPAERWTDKKGINCELVALSVDGSASQRLTDELQVCFLIGSKLHSQQTDNALSS